MEHIASYVAFSRPYGTGLEGEVFAPLRDLDMFNAVELDETFGTVQWPNDVDFDPETLHDWPKYCDELVAMARRWATDSNPARRTAGR